MKRLIPPLLIILLVLPLCGCMNGETGSTTTAAPTTQPPTTTEAPSTAVPTTQAPTTSAPRYTIKSYSAFGSYSKYGYGDIIPAHVTLYENGTPCNGLDVYFMLDDQIVISDLKTDNTGFVSAAIEVPSIGEDRVYSITVHVVDYSGSFQLGTVTIKANPLYPIRTIEVNDTISRMYGETLLTLEKIGICKGCTIAYITVDNASTEDIRIWYNTQCYLVLDRKQYEHKYIGIDVDEIYKIPPGVLEEGCIVFEPLPEDASGILTVVLGSNFITDPTWEVEI